MGPEGQFSRTVRKRSESEPPEIATDDEEKAVEVATHDKEKPVEVAIPPSPSLPPSRFIRHVSVPFNRSWGKRKSFMAKLRHQLEEEIIFCGACEKEHAN